MIADPVAAMRHRLTIEEPADAPDGQGGATRTWVTVATVWGGLRALSASEQVEADAVEHIVTHRAIIRWRSDMTTQMRLRLGTRIFAIAGMRDADESKRFLQIDTEEAPR